MSLDRVPNVSYQINHDGHVCFTVGLEFHDPDHGILQTDADWLHTVSLTEARALVACLCRRITEVEQMLAVREQTRTEYESPLKPIADALRAGTFRGVPSAEGEERA